jgi:hypothetical protein
MKTKIIEIMDSPFPYSTKADQLIILFNEHLLEKAKESDTVVELLDKAFININ